jgi:hypothetical protein
MTVPERFKGIMHSQTSTPLDLSSGTTAASPVTWYLSLVETPYPIGFSHQNRAIAIPLLILVLGRLVRSIGMLRVLWMFRVFWVFWVFWMLRSGRWPSIIFLRG